ncbi:MAG: YbhB/YbcL family Raf kinase inhibitor-like protein [Deltaproteobacteria bacterium]
MKRARRTAAALLVLGWAAGSATAMELTSRDIKQDMPIPDAFTCEGSDISPQLAWKDVPEGVESFVLICDDPDAPAGTWVHWVVYNIPADVRELAPGAPASERWGDGTRQGMTDFGRVGYGGPCPPPGKPHRYYFTLYALDARLSLERPVRKEEVVKALQPHLLGKAVLMGTYQR